MFGPESLVDHSLDQSQPDTQAPNKTESIQVSPEFLQYSTIDYISQIYPKLKLSELTEVVEDVQRVLKISDEVNVGEIAQKHGLEDSVIVENIAFLEFNHRVGGYLLNKYPDDHKSALEIDGGGVVIGNAAPSLVANQIVRFEYLADGETESLLWMNNDQDAYDWDSYFTYLQEKFRQDTSFQELLAKQVTDSNPKIREHADRLQAALTGSLEDYKNWVRGSINQNILRGDIFEENFGLDQQKITEQFDITTAGQKVMVDLVVSNFTSESATSDRSRWKIGLRNIMSTVKPGGELVLTACLEADYYLVGNKSFPAVRIVEDDVMRIAQEFGFTIVVRAISSGGNGDTHGYQKLGQWCFEKRV